MSNTLIREILGIIEEVDALAARREIGSIKTADAAENPTVSRSRDAESNAPTTALVQDLASEANEALALESADLQREIRELKARRETLAESLVNALHSLETLDLSADVYGIEPLISGDELERDATSESGPRRSGRQEWARDTD